MKQLTLP